MLLRADTFQFPPIGVQKLQKHCQKINQEMNVIIFLSLTLASAASVWSVATIEKVDVKILDPSKGTCKVIVNPGPPRSVDLEVESFIEAKDITVSLVLVEINVKGCAMSFVFSQSLASNSKKMRSN